MIHNAAGRIALLVAAVAWFAFQTIGQDSRSTLIEQIVELTGTTALAAPFEQAVPTAVGDTVEVVAGDVSVRVQRSNASIEIRVGDRPVWRDLGGISQDTHYGSFAYQRVGSSTWNHVTAVSTVESIASGQRFNVGTTEPGAGPARIDVVATAAGIVRIRFEPPAGSPIAWTVSSATSDETETFLGLGERFDGISLAGRRTELWAADRREVKYGDSTYLPVPWVLSNRGYGLLLDDARRSGWEMRSQRTDAWAFGVMGANLGFYLIGGNPAQAIDRYTALTGRPPLPPKWSLGVVKTLVGGEQRVLRDAALLRQNSIPVDALYVYDVEDDEANIGWPHVTFEPIPPGTYPDVKRLVNALHQQGFRVLGYFSPDFRPTRASFQTANRVGALVRGLDGKSWLHPLYGIGLIDAMNPRAVEWWQNGPIRRALTDLGFDGGMVDLGEAVPVETRFENNLTGADVHNSYTVAYTAAAFNALKKYKPDGLFFMRSGYTGGQAVHASTWSGDPIHNWDPVVGLKSIVPAGLGAGLAGYAYWHTEVGGYVDGGLDAVSERELYIRWLELASFTAMLRDQYGDRQSRPTYTFTDAETIALWQRYARIHQALVPYLWQTAQEAQAKGLPLMRHLAIAFPDDPRAWREEQQFLLGNDLLVAPVVDFGARERTVYLPRGEWRMWWTGQTYTGPVEVTVPAPLDQIPVFIRGGATMPPLPERAVVIP